MSVCLLNWPHVYTQEGLSPCHLKKAKLMFFYTRYPSSNTLKTYFPDVKVCVHHHSAGSRFYPEPCSNFYYYKRLVILTLCFFSWLTMLGFRGGSWL